MIPHYFKLVNLNGLFADPLAQSQTLFEAFNEKKKLKEVESEHHPAENGFVKNHARSELGEVLPDEKAHVQEIKKQPASKKKATTQVKPQKTEQDFLEEVIHKVKITFFPFSDIS